MKKFFTCFVMIMCMFFFNKYTYALTEEMNISDFLQQMEDYQNEFIPEISDDAIEKMISGNLFDSKTFIETALGTFSREIKDSLKMIFSIIAVSILCAILKNIQSSFGR